jgi:hypothetical protein
MRLVQLKSDVGETRVAAVEEDSLRLLKRCNSVYELAQKALEEGKTLIEMATLNFAEAIPYEPVYRGESRWRLLPPFTHPEPARCLVAGTGLTHKASADNRQAMHRNQAELSDSMRMYLMGVEGGRPGLGKIGVAPEWFF